jgi:hypothetical protein
MQRRYRAPIISIEDLIDRASRIFSHPVYVNLREMVIRRAASLPPANTDAISGYSRWLDYIAKLVSKDPTDRFFVDAWLVNDIAQTLSTDVQLSKAIVPFYLGEWFYFVPPQPFDSLALNETIYGVSFPGEQKIQDLQLLRYPWLLHEIGHHYLDRSCYGPLQSVDQHVTEYITKQRRRLHSASPEVRQLIESRVATHRKLWAPTINRQNWSVEVFADVLSVWLCGPAFLAAFEEDMAKAKAKPFEINETHPPAYLRVNLIVEIAEKLGWDEYLEGLRALLREWKLNTPSADYALFCDLEFSSKVSAAAVAACKSSQLPVCDSAMICRIRELVATARSPQTAVDVIVGAWLKEREFPEEFLEWESSALRLLADELQGDA